MVLSVVERRIGKRRATAPPPQPPPSRVVPALSALAFGGVLFGLGSLLLRRLRRPRAVRARIASRPAQGGSLTPRPAQGGAADAPAARREAEQVRQLMPTAAPRPRSRVTRAQPPQAAAPREGGAPPRKQHKVRRGCSFQSLGSFELLLPTGASLPHTRQPLTRRPPAVAGAVGGRVPPGAAARDDRWLANGRALCGASTPLRGASPSDTPHAACLRRHYVPCMRLRRPPAVRRSYQSAKRRRKRPNPKAFASDALLTRFHRCFQVQIGRVASNDFVINDTEVSSQHARLAWDTAASVWQLVRAAQCREPARLAGTASVSPVHTACQRLRRAWFAALMRSFRGRLTLVHSTGLV